MGFSKGQGAFEYMMSYGWAVLVVVVLAVMLWNIGVFNPQQGSQAIGFSIIRPVAWNFIGGNTGQAFLTIALANVGGIDVTLGVNGSNEANTVKFTKPGARNCGFINQSINVTDSLGGNMSVVDMPVYGISTVGLSAGNEIVLSGLVVGAAPGYACGGASGGAYAYTVTYQYAHDQFDIQHQDSGVISGKFA